MILRELVKEGEEALVRAGVPDARRDARTLFLDTFHISAAEYILYSENTPEQAFPTLGEGLAMPLGYYRDRIRMRAARIPLQQILGETSFMGLDFKVNEFTLSPRQDTEVLVEEVLKDHEGKDIKVLDLCTGTGCIGISLGVLGNLSEVTLTDLSKEALEVARFNADKLGTGSSCRFETLEGDLFEALPAGKTFDVIVSNPPYIADAVIETLEPEVKTYEPRMALSGGKDGLVIYRRLIKEAPKFAPVLYLEIGYDQADAVTALMKEAGYKDIEVIKDFGGNDRVVKGTIH